MCPRERDVDVGCDLKEKAEDAWVPLSVALSRSLRERRVFSTREDASQAHSGGQKGTFERWMIQLQDKKLPATKEACIVRNLRR